MLMSNSDKEIKAGDFGGGGDDDDEEDGDDDRGVSGRGDGNQNQRGRWYKMGFRRAKQVVLSSFRKVRKQNCNSSSSGSGGDAATKESRRGKRMIGCCTYLCLKQPPTLESPIDSNSSDPNNPDFFTYESLKNLLENNDFYSKECNTHIYITSPHSD